MEVSLSYYSTQAKQMIFEGIDVSLLPLAGMCPAANVVEEDGPWEKKALFVECVPSWLISPTQFLLINQIRHSSAAMQHLYSSGGPAGCRR